jgi:hypothetical protein
MNTELNGKTVTVPFCTCGKCIVKRMRKDFFSSFPYSKNLGSTYVKDFDWKTQEKGPEFYNRSKHSGFEGTYKEHLPTSLVSTMKFDYRPFQVKMEEEKPQEQLIESVPFFGRSTYSTNYPNWGSTHIGDNKGIKLPEIKVPLRGKSNYKENYGMYDPKFYKQRDPTNFQRNTLEFFGKLNPDTIYGTSYKPVNFKLKHYFGNETCKKHDIEKSSMIPADFPKSNFESNYSQSFVDFKDNKCQLAEYLKKSGIKWLEV